MENQDWKLGLRPKTIPVFEAVSQMDVVKGLFLCGDTAQYLVTPSLQELLGMKLFTITVRSAFRDYYDIYALLKEGYDLAKGVEYADKFSRHTIHSKQIYSILLNENYFSKPEGFSLLDPKYDVSTAEIAVFVRRYIEEQGIKIRK